MDLSIDQLAAELERAGSELASGYESVFVASLPLVRGDVQSNFENAQTAGGIPWKPRKDQKSHPLLRLSGALYAAAVGQGAGHVEEIAGNTLTFGVENIVYAPRQNYGDEPG